MNRTSRLQMLRSPGLEDKFLMPLPFPEQDLLNAARRFWLTRLLLKRTSFVRRCPRVFWQLTTAISDFETAINEGNRTKGAKVSAHEAQDEDISEAMSLLRHLDLVMRNKFAGNRAMRPSGPAQVTSSAARPANSLTALQARSRQLLRRATRLLGLHRRVESRRA
jgi:hypothetical protein